MVRKLPYCRGSIAHIYLRAVSGFVVFYSVKDILVFFTLLNVLSETYGIRICVVSIMLNHFHLLIEAENHNAIAKFMKELSRRFTAEFNGRIGRKERLFEGPFGLSVKAKDKKVRTAISYSTTIRWAQTCAKRKWLSLNFRLTTVSENWHITSGWRMGWRWWMVQKVQLLCLDGSLRTGYEGNQQLTFINNIQG